MLKPAWLKPFMLLMKTPGRGAGSGREGCRETPAASRGRARPLHPDAPTHVPCGHWLSRSQRWASGPLPWGRRRQDGGGESVKQRHSQATAARQLMHKPLRWPHQGIRSSREMEGSPHGCSLGPGRIRDVGEPVTGTTLRASSFVWSVRASRPVGSRSGCGLQRGAVGGGGAPEASGRGEWTAPGETVVVAAQPRDSLRTMELGTLSWFRR